MHDGGERAGDDGPRVAGSGGGWLMRRPPGQRGKSMAPDRSASPEDDAGHAGVPQAADAVEVADAARDEDVGVVVDGRGRRARRGSGSRRRGSARTGARRARRAPRPGRRASGSSSAATGTRRSRSGRGSRPTASQSPATATQSRSARAARRWPWTGRPGSRRRRTPAGSGRRPRGRRRAGAAPRPARRSRPTASRLHGRRAPGAVEVDEVDDRAPCATNCSAIRSGRSVGAPTPADAPGQ